MEFLQSFMVGHTAWFVVICIVIVGILVLSALWAYGLSLPQTKAEKNMKLPGDDLLGNEPKLNLGLAITINAPREKVWKYLAQLGARRAGFYSFQWLERLFTFHIYNTYSVVDEWQDMYPGEFMFYHQDGIGSEIKEVKPGQYFTSISDSRNPSKFQGAIGFVPPFGMKFFAWTWNFHLLDAGEGKTRFITRCDSTFQPFTGFKQFLVILILGTPSFVMSVKMMKTIKKCAEGRKMISRLFK